jgi:hypothetical protein
MFDFNMFFGFFAFSALVSPFTLVLFVGVLLVVVVLMLLKQQSNTTQIQPDTKLLEPQMPTQASAPILNAATELIKMKELLDIGAVTQEEFDVFKKKMLGR